MVQITAAVERDVQQAQVSRLPRDGGANQLALLHFRSLLGRDVLIPGRSGNQRLARVVVDQLRVNLGIAPKYG